MQHHNFGNPLTIKRTCVIVITQAHLGGKTLTNRDAVIFHIENKTESLHVDFKRDFYKNLRASDFPKDIAAFANQNTEEDCYIIFGIEDKNRHITGIRPSTYIGIDSLDNFLERTVEPFVRIESELFQYNGKTMAYIKICKENKDRPYVIKETCGRHSTIEKGDIYIRKGTCNQKASRMDLDDMYEK